ncbi:MAG: PDZ domain-containing protein [Lentisphaerae bacterium]|nr:PDZ domain-containing protein [Lentisphaerota bacterium]
MDILRIIGALLFLIFFFGFCIFIHELGHFLAAKWRGLHIIAFSLGFRKFWSKKINGVEYRLGYLPFGGYVELPQVDSSGIPTDENGNELPQAKPFDRICTAVAGPLFNVLFGLSLGCLVWWFGVPQDSPKMKSVTVSRIDTSGPEYAAGLRSGDKIYKLNGKTFNWTWNEFIQSTMLAVGNITLEIERGSVKQSISYTPHAGSPFANPELRREKIAYPFFIPQIPITLFPEKDSPAARAGVERGDIVLELNSEPAFSLEDFQNQIDLLSGKPFDLKVKRGEEIVLIKGIQPEVYQVPDMEPDYKCGFVYSRDKVPFEIVDTVPGMPAAEAGLKAGDRVVKINGTSIKGPNELTELIQNSKGAPLKLDLMRDGKALSITMTPREMKHYTIGAETAIYNYPSPFQQFAYTIDLSYKSLRGIFFGLAKKIGLTESGSTIGFRNLSGPLGMGRVLFVSVYRGSFMYGIYFVVIISFALAIFNILPLPVLDGGHTTLALLEIIFRRKIPEVVIRYISYCFVTLLVGLMVFVTLMDIQRMLPTKTEPTDYSKLKLEDANVSAESNSPDQDK